MSFRSIGVLMECFAMLFEIVTTKFARTFREHQTGEHGSEFLHGFLHS